MSTATPPRPRACTLHVRGIKVTTLIPPDALPKDLIPPEPAPAGDPVIDLALEGSPLVVRAKLNGKSVRKVLKTIAEHGPAGVNVMLQGNLKPGPTPGGPFVLESAGLAVTPKVPKEPAP
jgi:hypothetical protein